MSLFYSNKWVTGRRLVFLEAASEFSTSSNTFTEVASKSFTARNTDYLLDLFYQVTGSIFSLNIEIELTESINAASPVQIIFQDWETPVANLYAPFGQRISRTYSVGDSVTFKVNIRRASGGVMNVAKI